jgi:hypothetical protein
MTVSGLDDPEVQTPSPGSQPATDPVDTDEQELVEWWKHETLNTDPDDEPRPALANFEDVERLRAQSLMFICGAVVVCALLGALIGPRLLVGPFESLTGTTVDDLSDLRGMGTLGGIVIGLFIGSTGGWVIWSSR